MAKFKNKSYNAWKICVLCKNPILPQVNKDGFLWDRGHNPYPLATKGSCCGDCNHDVIYARLKEMLPIASYGEPEK